MPYFYELTEYPRIFKKTYWGTFNRNDYEMAEIMEIINNRNEFIKKYNIKQCIPKYKLPKKVFNETIINDVNDMFLFDHVEYYKSYDNKYYMLNSPYTNEGSNVDKRLSLMRFEKIVPLYFKNAVTFIKEIVPVKKMNPDYAKNYYYEKRKKMVKCDECDFEYSLSNRSKHVLSEKHKLGKKCNDLMEICKFFGKNIFDKKK